MRKKPPNKTFCMMPWISIHRTPNGHMAPCCVSKSCGQPKVYDDGEKTIQDHINSDFFKKLRVDMMNGVKNPECEVCYLLEENDVSSFRTTLFKAEGQWYDYVMDRTEKDGTINDFKMRYFDIRFSNICNFKCRTCGPGYSTQWEQENEKQNLKTVTFYNKRATNQLLNEVIEHVPYMDIAYFAGGEPLITEEHYILLEEMIKQNRTDIQIRYNTNLSNINFKDKDLLQLWRHFKFPIDVSASIDHYGERAEYIRHGTNWGKVEENFRKVREAEYVTLSVNTVVSVFNYLTILDFYKYMVDKNLYTPKDLPWSLYHMHGPKQLSAHILPIEFKKIGNANLKNLSSMLLKKKFGMGIQKAIKSLITWVEAYDTWEKEKDLFRSEVNRLDRVRGENFEKVFPELANLLLKNERKKLWPV